jgi:catechol 2,3-dioxygenase-like lactoylglutathione lyase family enzyme
MHVAFRVPDVAAAREELEAKGVEFTDETYESGACHMAFLTDPDGNELMLRRPYAPYE